MYFELLGNVPVLSIRREPLELRENRVLKRIFDIISSSVFLCTIFPLVYIIVGTAIKLSSPGPIFFKQKRSGEDGREFWCYKFRSMKVNAQCDILQATAMILVKHVLASLSVRRALMNCLSLSMS